MWVNMPHTAETAALWSLADKPCAHCGAPRGYKLLWHCNDCFSKCRNECQGFGEVAKAVWNLRETKRV